MSVLLLWQGFDSPHGVCRTGGAATVQDAMLDIVVDGEVEMLESLLLLDDGTEKVELEALVLLGSTDKVVELAKFVVVDEDANLDVTDAVELNFEETGEVVEVVELSLDDAKTELEADFEETDEGKLELKATEELLLLELTFTPDDEETKKLEDSFELELLLTSGEIVDVLINMLVEVLTTGGGKGIG